MYLEHFYAISISTELGTLSGFAIQFFEKITCFSTFTLPNRKKKAAAKLSFCNSLLSLY